MTDLDVQDHHAVDRSDLAPLEWPAERIVRPAKRRFELRDLFREGPVIRVLASRDFRVKYKQSLIGPLWLVVPPLALLAAFLLAFRGLADVEVPGVPYLPFALVGLTNWTFFQAAMMVGSLSLVANMNYVRFTPCPRAAFPVAAVIASLPAFGVTAVAALVAAAGTGNLSLRVLLLPFSLLWLTTFTLALVGITSSLAVRYRDIVNALPLFLQLGLFVSPVGYPLGDLSPVLRTFVELNPITGVTELARWMMLSGYEVSAETLALSLASTAVISLVSWRLFSRLETTMADDI